MSFQGKRDKKKKGLAKWLTDGVLNLIKERQQKGSSKLYHEIYRMKQKHQKEMQVSKI